MGLVIFFKKIKVIIKNSKYISLKKLIQCCIENIEDFWLIKPSVFLVFLKETYAVSRLEFRNGLNKKIIKERRQPIYFKRIS